MCRFLLMRSTNQLKPKVVLESFAQMAKKSKAFDGDWQGDGWGVSWIENNSWKNYRSLKPIWEDTEMFDNIPSTSVLSIHARSASFPQHKNNIAYNQPYIENEYSFVFNGLLKGVKLLIPGDIGAQKIWFLLKRYVRNNDLRTALEKIKMVLEKNSTTIQALNVGIADHNTIAACSFYSEHPEYYTLHYVDSPEVKIICSEEIEGFQFKSLRQNSFLSL